MNVMDHGASTLPHCQDQPLQSPGTRQASALQLPKKSTSPIIQSSSQSRHPRGDPVREQVHRDQRDFSLNDSVCGKQSTNEGCDLMVCQQWTVNGCSPGPPGPAEISSDVMQRDCSTSTFHRVSQRLNLWAPKVVPAPGGEGGLGVCTAHSPGRVHTSPKTPAEHQQEIQGSRRMEETPPLTEQRQQPPGKKTGLFI